MKEFRKIVVIILVLTVLISSTSCSNATSEYRDKKHVEDILEEYYGGEFVVYETYHKQGQLFAEAAWGDIPGHVFTVCVNGLTIDYRYKNEPYIAIIEKGIEDTISVYMQEYYPCAFYRASIMDLEHINKSDEKNLSYEELLDGATSITGCRIYVFIDKDIGTPQKYKEEYTFFTEVVDSFIDQNKIIPITISFYHMDKSEIEYFRTYLEKSDNDNHFFNQLQKYKKTAVCFKKDEEMFIKSYKEYKAIREAFDNE